MNKSYIGVIEPGDTGDYAIWFPDIDGCVAMADSLPELEEAARDVLGEHLAALVAGGIEPPAARDHETIVAALNPGGRVLFLDLILARMPPSRVARVNLTFDPSLLVEIDRAAEAEGISRAAFVSRAAVDRIKFVTAFPSPKKTSAKKAGAERTAMSSAKAAKAKTGRLTPKSAGSSKPKRKARSYQSKRASA